MLLFSHNLKMINSPKWYAGEGACFSGCDICLLLFCCCAGVPWPSTSNHSTPSNAMDRSPLNVWVDIYTFLPLVWKLFALSVSVGKGCGKSIWTISGSSCIFGLWTWKRLVHLIRSLNFILQFYRCIASLLLAFCCFIGHQRQQSCCDIAAWYYGLGMAFLAIAAPALPGIFGVTSLFLRYFQQDFCILVNFVSFGSCLIIIVCL